VIPVWFHSMRRSACCFLSFGFAALWAEASVPVISFEREIRPLLKAHCFHCHGENDKPKAGVDLRLRKLMVDASTNNPGRRIVKPGHPNESKLLEVIESGEMPKEGKPLPAEAVSKIRQWIEQGAPTLRPEPDQPPRFFITEEERSFWAFQPIRKRTPLSPTKPGPSKNPVDQFLLAALEQKGLSFANPAEPRVLIRRLSFDLTGLPPEPEDVEKFVSDPSDASYARLADQYLASPHFGERWARHWLDVAGYADSNGGGDTDSERSWAWRYRDYVIRAFNSDKPLNQFIIEQLAGDELIQPPFETLGEGDLDKLIATGFLRMAPDPTGDGPADADLARNQVIADTLQIVSSSLLGLTVQCAQCHDHRYDPISQEDYYAMRAFFEPAFDWKRWKNPGQRMVSLMANDDRKLSQCIEQAAVQIDKEAQKLHDDLIEEFVAKQLELVPPEQKEPVMAARKTPAANRTDAQKKLLREFPTFQDHIILGEINPEGAKKVAAVRERATQERASKPPDPMVHALVEEPGSTPDTFLFHRGDHKQPRDKVSPGALAVLGDEARISTSAPTNTARGTSGRRLALARSLVDGKHPLPPRVLANRLWSHLFGSGIAPTLGDLGFLGERPSHPELLDWLASELVDGDWKVKPFLRTLVLSAAYRQSSANPRAAQVDPDNRLLGRFRLRRLDAEALRDSWLAISGKLNPRMFGSPVPVAFNNHGQVVAGSQMRDGNGDPTGAGGLGTEEFRRSIYLQWRRTMTLDMVETFDAPAMTPNCEIRPTSTAATQALMLLNDPFILARSEDLAARLRGEHPGDLRKQIDRLWRLGLSRPVPPNLLEQSLVYLAEQTESVRLRTPPKTQAGAKTDTASTPDPSFHALASLCQAVIGSNPFLYLD